MGVYIVFVVEKEFFNDLLFLVVIGVGYFDLLVEHARFSQLIQLLGR